MPYHSKGINKNKKIRAERLKPLPLEIMKNETKRIEPVRRDEAENSSDSEII